MTELNGMVCPIDNLLTQNKLDKLKKFVNRLDFENNPSFVYQTVEKKNIIDPEVRQSKTCISRETKYIIRLFVLFLLNI